MPSPVKISKRKATAKATIARRPLSCSAYIVKPTDGRKSSSVIIFIVALAADGGGARDLRSGLALRGERDVRMGCKGSKVGVDRKAEAMFWRRGFGCNGLQGGRR